MGNSVKSLKIFTKKDQKKNYKAVQSCEEGGSGGAYLEPLVALAQNGANMHNVLGPACIFLRKGFAESRQAVPVSHYYYCPFIIPIHLHDPPSSSPQCSDSSPHWAPVAMKTQTNSASSSSTLLKAGKAISVCQRSFCFSLDCPDGELPDRLSPQFSSDTGLT
ncbi:calcium-binding protein 1 isoform X1 [Lates japonicus]|uniref:Calcium-binding protein 1 isoform X1 n=1 Tax=Lates japonicus TaxID=270547 RepID=A0AAD3NJ39_LATJO|nr:calcium-binding protein 1 isoform X1 [Lates japonicus]